MEPLLEDSVLAISTQLAARYAILQLGLSGLCNWWAKTQGKKDQ
jgi:hypothetical protein